MLFWWEYETGMGIYAVLVWHRHAGDVYCGQGILGDSFDCGGVAAFLFVVFVLKGGAG